MAALTAMTDGRDRNDMEGVPTRPVTRTASDLSPIAALRSGDRRERVAKDR